MPTMASGSDSPSGLDDTSSLEIALDRAIAQRLARLQELSVQEPNGGKRRNTPTARLEAQRPDMAHTPTEKLTGRPSTALAVTSSESSLMRPPARLRWKGIEVTDEFQEYAARVERGEDLAPYRGPVLSRPSAEFPWNIAPRTMQMLPPPHPSARDEQRSTSLDDPRHSLAPQRLSLAPMAVPVSARPISEPTVYPERGRALKTALWLAGAVSSIVGALGVGAGATSTAGNEFDDRIPDPGKLGQKPAPTAAHEQALASTLDDDAPTLEPSIRERQLDSLAATGEQAASAEGTTPAPGPVPAPPPARSLTPRSFPAPPPAGLLPPRPLTPPAPRVAAGVGPASVASSAAVPSSSAVSSASSVPSEGAPSSSRLSIPPPGPIPSANEIASGVVTTARPAAADGRGAREPLLLFSDRAPF